MWRRWLIPYQVVAIATFVDLTFFDLMPHDRTHWIIVTLLNCLFAEIWPLYWIGRLVL
jgi:hypothetical protein